ncbi:MAG TPA: hypothetical protein VIJ50_01685 [Solirubrobacteraceae bacterium]
MPDLVLEQRLRELCFVGTERDARLDLDLARIREAQATNWRQVTLAWFSDHSSEGHSRRIIELLAKAFDGEDLLTRNELFVLLAACYLHDLGMQDAKIDGRGIEEMTSQDWDLVRERHPEWSRKLIIDRTLARLRDQFEIGLPANSDFLEPIAIVAESHGSRFFDDDVLELRERKLRPGNDDARLPAVAAMLMMADELDLHGARVADVWPQDTHDLSPTGQLHFYVHQYVTTVDFVRRTPTSIRHIFIRLSFPESSDEYRAGVSEWLARRLLKQARRSNAVLIDELDGAFAWGPKILLDSEVVEGPIFRDLPDAARRRLAVELARDRLIDRTQIRDEIETGIRERADKLTIVGLRDERDSDAGYLLQWTLALAASESVIALHLDLTARLGYDVRDLPEVFRSLVAADAGPSKSVVATGPERHLDVGLISRARTPNDLQDAVLGAVGAGAAILLLQNPSAATKEVESWCEALLQRAATLTNGFIVVIDGSKLNLPESASVHRLKPFRAKHLALHLTRVLGYKYEEAAAEAEMLCRLANGASNRILYEMLRRVTAFVEPSL